MLSREGGNGLWGSIIGDYIGATIGIHSPTPTKNQTGNQDRLTQGLPPFGVPVGGLGKVGLITTGSEPTAGKPSERIATTATSRSVATSTAVDILLGQKTGVAWVRYSLPALKVFWEAQSNKKVQCRM